MLMNLIVGGEVRRHRWLTPIPLTRPDRARPIDRVIDYFGGSGQHGSPVPMFHTRPGQERDDQQAQTPRRQG